MEVEDYCLHGDDKYVENLSIIYDLIQQANNGDFSNHCLMPKVCKTYNFDLKFLSIAIKDFPDIFLWNKHHITDV